MKQIFGLHGGLKCNNCVILFIMSNFKTHDVKLAKQFASKVPPKNPRFGLEENKNAF